MADSFEDFYILAYAEVLDSEAAEAERDREEREKREYAEKRRSEGMDLEWEDEYPTGEQRMMTSRLDLKSSPRAPQWLDENVVVRTLLHLVNETIG